MTSNLQEPSPQVETAAEPSPVGRFYQLANGHLAFGTTLSHACSVTLVAAFPLSEPRRHVSAVDAAGRVLWSAASLDELTRDELRMVERELDRATFLPVVKRLLSFTASTWPASWHAVTDRGSVELTLENEDAIRRLDARSLLLRDASGLEVLVRNVPDLDRVTRRLLSPYL